MTKILIRVVSPETFDRIDRKHRAREARARNRREHRRARQAAKRLRDLRAALKLLRYVQSVGRVDLLGAIRTIGCCELPVRALAVGVGFDLEIARSEAAR